MWLALRFPHWALDCRADILSERPEVVVETRAGRQWLIAASRPALAAGLSRGITLADARSRQAELIVHERHPAAEQAALARLAGWAWRYSHQIHWAIQQPNRDTARLVFEIGASQRLFGGRDALLATIGADLRRIGHRYRRGLGATPQAALALSRGRQARQNASIDHLPIRYLDLSAEICATLEASGIIRTAELLALPPSTLARRFGREPLMALERLQGHRPHGLALYQQPLRYETRHELFSSVENTQGLIFVLRRVFDELAVFLGSADSAIQTLRLSLIHENIPPTPLRLVLSAPSHDARHLERVAHERLAQTTLVAPVIEIALKSDRLRRNQHPQARLWQQAGQSTRDDPWPGLVDRLRARLGHEAIAWVGDGADHRPEQASRWQDTPPARPSDRALLYAGSQVDALPRPCWLFDPPEVLSLQTWQSLQWISGPERIESGWWAQGKRRDYFRALDGAGRLLWVFRDLKTNDPQGSGYYLHGLFG